MKVVGVLRPRVAAQRSDLAQILTVDAWVTLIGPWANRPTARKEAAVLKVLEKIDLTHVELHRNIGSGI